MTEFHEHVEICAVPVAERHAERATEGTAFGTDVAAGSGQPECHRFAGRAQPIPG